jgi:protein O-GlcNAc transferase
MPVDDSITLYEEAKSLILQKKYSKAFKKSEKALKVDPNNCDVQLCYLFLKKWFCDWDNYESQFGQYLNCLNNKNVSIDFPFCYIENIGQNSYSRIMDVRYSNVTTKNSVHKERRKNRKIKIGYVSVDFRSHSGGWSLKEIISNHDKGQFETYGLSFAPSYLVKDVENEYSNSFDHFVSFANVSLKESVSKIKKYDLDLLVDTTRNILGAPDDVLANRLAPVQISAWGYGNSSRNPNMDYILTDKYMISENNNSNISEKALYISAYHYCPVDDYDPLLPRPELSREKLPENAIIYANFNAHYKINPFIFKTWMKILLSVPNSYLWLSHGCEQSRNNLLNEASNYGINEDKIIFASILNRKQHLNRISLCTVILDNPLMGGGATIADGLSVDVPVVSMKGTDMTNRNGESILMSMKLPELVANDYCEYTKIAINLALDNMYRKEVSKKIKKNKINTNLFSKELFISEFEKNIKSILN